MTPDEEEPLRKYYYVKDKQTFEELGDGLVRVTAEDGRSGVFHWSGQFVEGDLTQCNLHMLNWCGGARLPKALNLRWVEYPFDVSRPSFFPEEIERLIPHNIAKR
jgi:hypothetical protein